MRSLLLFVLGLSLLGCDGSDAPRAEIGTPTGPFLLTIGAHAYFQNDRVVLELDGQRIADERVTTSELLGNGYSGTFQVAEGPHRLRATVNGRAVADLRFDTADGPYVDVRYERMSETLTLAVAAEVPCCWD